MNYNLSPIDAVLVAKCGCCDINLVVEDGEYNYCKNCKLIGKAADSMIWCIGESVPPKCNRCCIGWMLDKHFYNPRGFVRGETIIHERVKDPNPNMWYPLWVVIYGQASRTYGKWLPDRELWETPNGYFDDNTVSLRNETTGTYAGKCEPLLIKEL